MCYVSFFSVDMYLTSVLSTFLARVACRFVNKHPCPVHVQHTHPLSQVSTSHNLRQAISLAAVVVAMNQFPSIEPGALHCNCKSCAKLAFFKLLATATWSSVHGAAICESERLYACVRYESEGWLAKSGPEMLGLNALAGGEAPFLITQ
jgi:hypothetical protein